MLTQSNDVSTIFKKMEQIRNRVGNSTAVPSRDCDIRVFPCCAGFGKGPFFLCREVINFVMK